MLQAVYSPSMLSCVKLTILLLYLRDFTIFRKAPVYEYPYPIVASDFASSVAGIYIQIFACTPQAKIGDLTLESGHCVNFGHNYALRFLPYAMSTVTC